MHASPVVTHENKVFALLILLNNFPHAPLKICGSVEASVALFP